MIKTTNVLNRLDQRKMADVLIRIPIKMASPIKMTNARTLPALRATKDVLYPTQTKTELMMNLTNVPR